MKSIKLNLYGGRIDCVKFALKVAIEKFEQSNQHDSTRIYRDMLAEIERDERNNEPKYYCTCPDVSI